MKKNILIFIAVIASLAIFFKHLTYNQNSSLDSSRPNILFIILDAARADHFSCYGYEKNTTPNIDSISQKGSIFLNHFSNETSTLGSISKMLFSRYFTKLIFNLDLNDWGIPCMHPKRILQDFDSQQVFLPKILSKHGYETVIFENLPWLTSDCYMAKSFDKVFTFVENDDVLTSAASWINNNSNQRFFRVLPSECIIPVCL